MPAVVVLWCEPGDYDTSPFEALGEVVVVEDNFGIKITELVGSAKS